MIILKSWLNDWINISNIDDNKITDDLLKKASTMFTGSIKKPEQWITCRFQESVYKLQL